MAKTTQNKTLHKTVTFGDELIYINTNGSDIMYIIFALFIADYILTFIGMQFQMITEANPLMGWLFNLDIGQGFLLRLALAIILLVPFYICKNKNYIFYKKSVKTVIVIYMPVMVLHARWLFYWLIN